MRPAERVGKRYRCLIHSTLLHSPSTSGIKTAVLPSQRALSAF
jgi:hypothetical protein